MDGPERFIQTRSWRVRRPTRFSPGPMRALAALAAVLCLGCAGQKGPSQATSEKPKESRWQVRVIEVADAGPYLDVRLFGKSVVGRKEGERRFFFPASEACKGALVEGSSALYRAVGPFGQFKDLSGQRCDPVGVASLVAWRDARAYRRDPFHAPRVQAEYHTVFENERVLLARGRFPLALEMRWPEPMDSVAVMPADPTCRAALAQGEATMEYHGSGPDVFILEVDEGQCPIVGFAIPTEQTP